MRLFEELSKGCKTANELHQAGFTPKLLINTGHYYAVNTVISCDFFGYLNLKY